MCAIDPPGQAAIIARVTARYRDGGRFVRHYVAGKLRWDPLTATLLRSGDLGTVTDIGCGRGQFAGLLLESGQAASVTGIDVNLRSLASARRALAGLPFVALARDVGADPRIPPCDTVLMADMLYQIPPDGQERLLRVAAASARRRLLIRAADPHAGWRAAFSATVERAGRRIWPHAGRRVAVRPLAWIEATVGMEGFAVRRLPSSAGTPFGNALLIAERA